MTKNYEPLKHLAPVGRTSARSLLFLAFCSFASAFNALAKDIERMPLLDNAGLAPVQGPAPYSRGDAAERVKVEHILGLT